MQKEYIIHLFVTYLKLSADLNGRGPLANID